MCMSHVVNKSSAKHDFALNIESDTLRTTSGRCSDTPIGGKLASESLKLNGPLWPSTKESAPEIWVEFRNGISLRERLVGSPTSTANQIGLCAVTHFCQVDCRLTANSIRLQDGHSWVSFSSSDSQSARALVFEANQEKDVQGEPSEIDQPRFGPRAYRRTCWLRRWRTHLHQRWQVPYLHQQSSYRQTHQSRWISARQHH